jgi:hypothetical protein
MRGSIPPLPQYAFMAWCSVKHRDNFTFLTFLLLNTLFSKMLSSHSTYRVVKSKNDTMGWICDWNGLKGNLCKIVVQKPLERQKKMEV